MKQHKSVLLFFLMLHFSMVAYSQQNILFLLLPTAGAYDEELKYVSKGFNDMFLIDVVNEMGKNFPCVGVTDPESIKACMHELRLHSDPAFGSMDEGPIINKIANSFLNYDYVVSYSMYLVSKEMVNASVKCANHEGKILVDFTTPVGVDEILTEGTIALVSKLIEKLKEYEICPYQGQLTISSENKQDKTSVSSNKPPCGSEIVTITNITTSHSNLSWKLNKDGLHKTSGTVIYENSEEYKTVTNYPCYKCENGSEGALKITETKNVEDNVEGLSKESMLKGINIDDARIKIDFRDDGTYTILVDATSKPGVRLKNSVKTIEGVCQDEKEPPINSAQKLDIPLSTTLGPFFGKPTDKVLTQNVFSETNNGEEKTKIKIEFTLTRE